MIDCCMLMRKVAVGRCAGSSKEKLRPTTPFGGVAGLMAAQEQTWEQALRHGSSRIKRGAIKSRGTTSIPPNALSLP